MIAANVKLSTLNTIEELEEAIDSIENDPRNIVGGYAQWCSGYETKLTAAAQRKVDQLRAKITKLDDETDEDDE